MRASLVPSLCLALAALHPSNAFGADPAEAPGASTAAAGTTRVLGFTATDQFEQAEALTRAIKQALGSSTNGGLGDGDFSLEVLTAALGCDDIPDAACLGKIATKTQSPKFVWGTLRVEEGQVTAELRLYDGNDTDKKAKLTYAATRDTKDPEFLELVAQALSELLGPLTYRVQVQSTAKEATVQVDGRSVGKLHDGVLTIALKLGTHKIGLVSSGKELGTETVRVGVSNKTKVQLTAPNQGGAAPSDNPEALEEESPPDTTGSSGKTQRTWGYITLGAGGVFLAAGGLAAVRLYQLNEDKEYKAYRAALSPSEDACSEAKKGRVVEGAMSPSDVRSTCDQAGTLEVAQLALFIGGGVAAATGITLLLTAKSDKPAESGHFEPTLRLGRDQTDVGLRVRF